MKLQRIVLFLQRCLTGALNKKTSALALVLYG